MNLHKPKTIFHDHKASNAGWDRHRAGFARDGIPFVLLAQEADHEVFLAVLVWGVPRTSEAIVQAIYFASEVSAAPEVQVM